MPGPNFDFAETAARVEQELKQIVRQINDQVVPRIRDNGESALRTLAQQLERLADSLKR